MAREPAERHSVETVGAARDVTAPILVAMDGFVHVHKASGNVYTSLFLGPRRGVSVRLCCHLLKLPFGKSLGSSHLIGTLLFNVLSLFHP